MKSKILLMLVCALGLVACQNVQMSKSEPPNVTMNYDLPGAPDKQPKLGTDTPELAKLEAGNLVDFRLENSRGNSPRLLLVVMGRVVDENSNEIIAVDTPFASGAYTLKLTRGNNNRQEIASGKNGYYKYSLIDITGNGNNNRPPLDPKIRVGPGN